MGNVLNQEEYLYSETWPKKAVIVVINTICDEALYGGGTWDYPTKQAIGFEKAQIALEYHFNLHYTINEIGEAVALLKERYDVWTKLMEHEKVLINTVSKKVSARAGVWEKLVKEDPRVKWYGSAGEEWYDDLHVIFKNPYKGTDDYVCEVSGLHIGNARRFDDVTLSPLPLVTTPPRRSPTIDLTTPERPLNGGINVNEFFGPDSPGFSFICKSDFDESVSAKKSASTRKAKAPKAKTGVLNSPRSSIGSNTSTSESSFSRICGKFKRRG